MAERIDPDLLYDLGHIETMPANNARHWVYGKGDHCEHIVELPYNESRVWCPLCQLEGGMSQLKKIFLPTTVQQVWHEHFNITTGQVESDRKRMEQHGRAHADQISEELGIAHAFERTDFSEMRKEAEKGSKRTQLGLEDNTKRVDEMNEALVSTHDRAVAEGRKESKGRFTF